MHQGGLDWILEILTDHGPGQTYHEPLVGKTVQSTRPGSGKRTDQHFSRKSPPTATTDLPKDAAAPTYTPGCVLRLRAEKSTIHSSFQPKVSFPGGENILLFRSDIPYRSSGRPHGSLQGFRGVQSSPESDFASLGSQSENSFGSRQEE